MTSCVATPRLRRAWYICSELIRGTLKSASPQRKSVGVLIRSACKKGNETFIHPSVFFQGGPSSCSYSRMYWSVPYPARMLDMPAPLVAALKRVGDAITEVVSVP